MRKAIYFILLSLLPLAVLAQGMESVAEPNEPHGMVITSVDVPARSIFAVNVKNIDGKEIAPFPSGVWLKPGQHALKGFGAVNARWARMSSRSNKRKLHDQLDPLVLNVEEGMAYYVGLQAIGYPDQWELVVWKTEKL